MLSSFRSRLLSASAPTLALLPLLAFTPAALANPWADSVVSYAPGSGGSPSFTGASSALGEPTRFTGVGVFPGAVTPFNSPFLPSELTQVAPGGQLTVRFDEPVLNDPLNPFGIDLLVFGNSFFWDPLTFAPVAKELSADGGTIEVSSDGLAWFTVSGSVADGLWPTMGYADVTDPFSPTAGAVPTDFTKPVNPALASAWLDADLPALLSLYNGSGGGSGVDIGALGLSSISFVRVSVAPGATLAVEIDAFSDVTAIPAPSALLTLPALLLLRRRRR
jgi:hypothetical protein